MGYATHRGEVTLRTSADKKNPDRRNSLLLKIEVEGHCVTACAAGGFCGSAGEVAQAALGARWLPGVDRMIASSSSFMSTPMSPNSGVLR